MTDMSKANDGLLLWSLPICDHDPATQCQGNNLATPSYNIQSECHDSVTDQTGLSFVT